MNVMAVIRKAIEVHDFIIQRSMSGDINIFFKIYLFNDIVDYMQDFKEQLECFSVLYVSIEPEKYKGFVFNKQYTMQDIKFLLMQQDKIEFVFND